MHVYKIVETLVEAGTDNTVREFDSLEEACDVFRRKCAETSLDSESGLHFTYRLIKQECGRRKKIADGIYMREMLPYNEDIVLAMHTGQGNVDKD